MGEEIIACTDEKLCFDQSWYMYTMLLVYSEFIGDNLVWLFQSSENMFLYICQNTVRIDFNV